MTNPVSGGFQLTPPTGLNDTVTYPTTPVNESAARQQMMDFYWQLMNEMNKPTLSAAAYAQYNKLFNGSFSVNQRQVSGTVTLAAGAYGHDRWKAGAGGCTYTFATSNNDTTITISAGSLIQVIEGSGLVSGTYTLSWNGTAQGKIGGGAYGSSGTSAIIVGGANLNVEFNAGTLNKVRFTPGDQILPFNLRSFGEELALCLRYYEKSYDYATAPGTNIGFTPSMLGSSLYSEGSASDTSRKTGTQSFRVMKRIAPTITYWDDVGNISKFSVDKGTSNNITGDAFSSPTASTGKVYSGFQRSDAAAFRDFSFGWAADAEL